MNPQEMEEKKIMISLSTNSKGGRMTCEVTEEVYEKMQELKRANPDQYSNGRELLMAATKAVNSEKQE